MAADGPAFVAAAVRAACMANAPRRTVSAVAAAVAGVFAHQPARAMRQAAPQVLPATQRAADLGGHVGENVPALVEALQSARSAQRKRKKERRRDAQAAVKAAAQNATAEAEGGSVGPVVGGQALTATTLLAIPARISLTRMDSQQTIESGSSIGSAHSFHTHDSYTDESHSPRLSAAPAATSPRIRERRTPNDAPAPPQQPGRQRRSRSPGLVSHR